MEQLIAEPPGGRLPGRAACGRDGAEHQRDGWHLPYVNFDGKLQNIEADITEGCGAVCH